MRQWGLQPQPHAAGTVSAPAPRSDTRNRTFAGIVVWVLIVYLIVPEGFDYSTLTEVTRTGSAATKLVWIALLGCGAVLVFSKTGKLMKLLRTINPFLLAVIGVAVLSLLWSIDPGTTLKRVVRLFTFLMVGLALALTGWHQNRFQAVVRPILTIMLFGSVIFCLVADPRLTMETGNSAELINSWHGLALQKNSLGSLAALGIIFWTHGYLSKQTGLMATVFGLAVSGICLIGSRSSTNLMGALFSAMFLLMLLRFPPGLRRQMPYIVGAFAALIMVYALAVLKLVPGLDILLRPIVAFSGKDLTFSGRTEIWKIINENIAEHPLLGTGYSAYWIGEYPWSPSYQFLTRLYFYPSQSHNGYLEVINDLGAVGGLLLMGFLIVYVRQSLQLLKPARSQAALYLTILFFQLIANLSEARWFSATSVEFLVVLLATCAMARNIMDQRAAKTAAQQAATAARMSVPQPTIRTPRARWQTR